MVLFIIALCFFAVFAMLHFIRVPGEEVRDQYGRRTGKREDPQRVPAVIRYSTLAIAGLFMLFACVTTVGAKNAGVLTTFGKPAERTLSSGLHFKLPWQKVTEIDGTVQPDEYKGDDCIYVRIGDGSKSCVSLTNRWRVSQDKANIVYQDYRSDDPTDQLRDSVVSTQLKAAVQEVMSQYNPIAELEVVEGDPASAASLNFAPDYDAVSQDIEQSMQERLAKTGNLAEIQDITVSYVSLSDTTQAKIDDFIAAVGDTRIALQKRATAAAEADANRTLSDSVSNDPNVLVSKCLDTLNAMVEAKQEIPAGFSCWPGSNGAVVVPSAAK